MTLYTEVQKLPQLMKPLACLSEKKWFFNLSKTRYKQLQLNGLAHKGNVFDWSLLNMLSLLY